MPVLGSVGNVFQPSLRPAGMSAAAPPVVVLADPIAPNAVAKLRAGPCTFVDATSGPDALAAALGDAWGLVVRSRTKVSAAMMEKAPKLKFIARAGVGVDTIDMPAASARGIQVVNAPTAATESVAELTVALMLMLARDLGRKVAETKAGGWKRSDLGGELSGKTVGFVGYGRIARSVVEHLHPFRVKPIAYDPYVTKTEDGSALVSLGEVLARSDFVCLHAASTPENRHLLDAAHLAQMKKGAYLVNVARGALVDEAALLAALESGQIAGAALDVFETEPPTLRALVEHPKVIATPHIGASTREGQDRAGLMVAEETIRALTGQPLHALVNPPGGSP
jgi:D-3-phosphoglycerate dehydrogenase